MLNSLNNFSYTDLDYIHMLEWLTDNRSCSNSYDIFPSNELKEWRDPNDPNEIRVSIHPEGEDMYKIKWLKWYFYLDTENDCLLDFEKVKTDQDMQMLKMAIRLITKKVTRENIETVYNFRLCNQWGVYWIIKKTED